MRRFHRVGKFFVSNQKMCEQPFHYPFPLLQIVPIQKENRFIRLSIMKRFTLDFVPEPRRRPVKTRI